jgi:hypothetical protein
MRFSMVLMGIAGLLAVACGSDDDKSNGSSGSTTVDSGVADDKVANQLTDQEAQRVCESVGKAAEAALGGAEAQKATCGFTAYTLASFAGGDDPAAACKMAYDECLKAPQDTTGGECTNPTSTCTATVGEIEKCFTDTLSQLSQLLSTLPGCDDVGKDVTPPSTEGTSPPSCEVVQEKCPEVLSDMTSML